MQWSDFEKNTQMLADWYKQTFSPQQMDIMYQEIKYIPAVAYKDIIKNLIKKQRARPTIADIKDGYLQWRASNPDKTMPYAQTYCLDCHGKGLLWTKEFNKKLGREYTNVYRCAACTNWRSVTSEKLPDLLRADAEKLGIKIEHPKHRAKSEDDLKPVKMTGRMVRMKCIGASLENAN